jgi:dihydroorotase
MISFKRRQLVAGMGTALATGIIGSVARAAMGPDDKFDLVIKGGEVLDPSQGLRGKRDIGIRYGRIEALEADIPVARANRVMNAAGRIVVPGLIDLHAHVFTSGIGIPADELVLYQGTTTVVSAGDAGASTFAT